MESTAAMLAAYVPAIDAMWEVRELPRPEPGPGEVLIQVRASGICYTDIWSTTGVIPVGVPGVVGHETVGEVVAVGAGVHSRVVGDRVATTWILQTCGRCEYCRRNKPVSGVAGLSCAAPKTSGFSVQGGHAEYLAAPEAATVLLPEGLSFELAAPVACAGYTTWSALCAGNPRPHERVAVVGIGGLGHMAVQYAKAAGFETIAITHSPDKRALALKLGADEVVSDGRELAAMGGADIILMTGNSNRAAMDSLHGLRPEGRMVLIGLPHDTDFVIPGPETGINFVVNRNQIIGATHGGFEYLTQALDFVATGKVTPMIETFPLARAADAYERVATGAVRFRAVITY
ncbi:alcohol dehydrogenase catalytic domain-containing protein [Nocardia albiluteola]|nr:alcohol dehydrogenase catalytic domain-containing protein [Nocardia albiluteola]